MKNKTYISSLPLQHPLLATFARDDIMSAGKDVRTGGMEWGEGVSQNHLVFMVKDGQMTSIGHKPVLTVRAKELLLVPAGLSKRLRLEHGGELQALWFHLPDVPAWQFLRGPQPLVLPAPEIDFLDALLTQLLRETELSASWRRMEIGRTEASLLRQYLEQYLRLPLNPIKLKLRQRLDALWHRVNCDLAFSWSVEQLARRVGLSQTHLHRCSLEFFGASPMQVVTRLRLDRAATLLRTTDYTLDDIARQIGYRNTPSFSDAFLRCKGQRPGAFRNVSL